MMSLHIDSTPLPYNNNNNNNSFISISMDSKLFKNRIITIHDSNF